MLVDAILRLIVIAVALMVAMWAAGVMLVVTLSGRLGEVVRAADGISDTDAAFDAFDRAMDAVDVLIGFVGSFTLTSVLGVALIGILIGETMRLRSWLYYVLGGGIAMAAAAAVQGAGLGLIDLWAPGLVVALVASGFVGGGVYWFLAGRRAGGRRR